MGSGNSRERYGSRPARQVSRSRYVGYGPVKRRSGLYRKVRPTLTTSVVVPIKYPSHHHHHPHRARPYVPPISAYPPVYPGYLPMPYNNYGISPYALPRQNYLIPPQLQQIQPMMIPHFQPMPMPQQVPPAMFSPYMPSPYSTGIPFSTPYMQQQPQVQPYYSNMGVSTPASTGIPVSTGPYSSSYPVTRAKLSTDWTGGGKISPGFLGPPI